MQEHMTRGENYMEEARYPEAIIEFKSVLQIDPNVGEAHYGLARAYLRTNKPREGFWELRETVRLDPANHDAKLEFSQLAILAGEQEEALRQASSVVEEDPSNIRARLLKGQALDQLDRRDEALESYEEALAAAPEDESAMRVVAKARGSREDYEGAEAVYTKLTELYPDFENYLAMARLVRLAGPERTDDQEAILKKGLEVAEGEKRPQAYVYLASFYYRLDRKDEAFAQLEEGIAKEEETLDLIYLLARLYRAEGNKAKADELIEKSTEARPDDPKVYLVLSSYRGRDGDYEGALAAAEKALELSPDDKAAKLQKAEVLVELGFKDEREAAIEESRAIVDAVLAAEPSEPRALMVDAKLELGAGRIAAAAASLRAGVDARPNWAPLRYLLGAVKALQGDFVAARTELARALEIDAGLLEAKAALTRVHFKLGEWDYCVERGREYLKEKPEEGAIRLLVAQSLLRSGEIDEAQEELEAVPAESRDGQILYALGRIELGRRNLEAAREYLLAADEMVPGNEEILQSLIALDRQQDRLGDSKARIAAALEAEPENAKLHQLAGVLAMTENRGEDAEESFRKAIELDPDDLSGYRRLARYYARTGRLEETARTYEKALEVNPEQGQLHHFLGVLYELSGDREQAIERYEEAIRHGPELAEAKNNLAYIYADSGQNLDRALDLAQDAKALLPDNPSVADTLGWVLFKRGVPSAAIGYLKEAEAATNPSDASLGVVRFHLAQAYEANGDTEDALAALDRALETLGAQMEAVRAQGREPGQEPAWAADARALRERVSVVALAKVEESAKEAEVEGEEPTAEEKEGVAKAPEEAQEKSGAQ
jgi:tetratricopeptide (TPR) repeat protein